MNDNLLKKDIRYYKGILQKLDKYTESFEHKTNKKEVDELKLDFSMLDYQHQKLKLTQLLANEDFIENEQIAEAVVRILCAELLNQMAKPLLEKQFNNKVLLINELISDIKISGDDILGADLYTKFVEADFIIEGLKYENISPLLIFEDFISFYQIYLLVDKETNTFKYRCSNDSPMKLSNEENEQWYSANTFYDICSHFTKMIDVVTAFLIQQIYSSSVALKINLLDHISMETIDSCKNPRDMYNYLKSLDVAKMTLPLSYLYLLLDCDNFAVFKDINIMNQIKESLLSEEPDGEKGYSFPLIKKVLINLSK